MRKHDTVFIICHTLFHYVTRSDQFRNQNKGLELYKTWLKSRFILEVIMEVQSESLNCKACTSKKIYDDLYSRLLRDRKDVTKYVRLLQSVIKPISEEDINQLNVDEGIIALADTLFNVYNKTPVIVTDMISKKIEVAKKYYKKSSDDDNPTIPFGILSLDEAIKILKRRHRDACSNTKKRNSQYNVL